jgi:hypothetical protein
MKLSRKGLSIYLLVLFCAVPCFIVGGEVLGLLGQNGGPQWNFYGGEAPERAGGETFSLIGAANLLYTHTALETRNQNHKASRLFVVGFMVMLFFGLQKLVIYVIKNSFCHIFNFLRCLAVSLLLSGQAPPLPVF